MKLVNVSLVASVSLVLAACGTVEKPQEASEIKPDSVQSKAETTETVETEFGEFAILLKSRKQLPACNTKNEGKLVHVKDEAKFFSCDGSEWVEADVQGKDGKDGKDGAAGQNGLNGSDNRIVTRYSCSLAINNYRWIDTVREGVPHGMGKDARYTYEVNVLKSGDMKVHASYAKIENSLGFPDKRDMWLGKEHADIPASASESASAELKFVPSVEMFLGSPVPGLNYVTYMGQKDRGEFKFSINKETLAFNVIFKSELIVGSYGNFQDGVNGTGTNAHVGLYGRTYPTDTITLPAGACVKTSY